MSILFRTTGRAVRKSNSPLPTLPAPSDPIPVPPWRHLCGALRKAMVIVFMRSGPLNVMIPT